MSDFTYELPDERRFFLAVEQLLSSNKSTGDAEISHLIHGGSCEFHTTNSFSRKRWDAYYSEVHFYLSIDGISKIADWHKIRLKEICQLIMPKKSGFDICEVDFAPLLEQIGNEPSLISDLENIINAAKIETFEILPEDIRRKGTEMAEVYSYLYCVENSLRIFINQVLEREFGINPFAKALVPISIKKSITVRKELESKNQWISIRGNNDLFYLDFKELGALIVNNWNLFKNYFPDQQWVNVKMEEMGNCRNLIAHNSYVGQQEKNLIKLYYNQILSQIGKSESLNSNQNNVNMNKEIENEPLF